jgi:nudix-type nucleoside diphosphatase (YffH/AdpP family)
VPPKIVDLRPVYQGWATISIATVKAGNGRTFERLMEDHGPGVCVLAYDPDRKVAMLVRQFRAPVCVMTGQIELVEAVAGLTDGEAAEPAILREAFEEAGLRLEMPSLVATVWTMPGISTECMHLFLARYCEADRVGQGGGNPSEHEDIAVLEVALAELARTADEGGITDMKTFALVQTLRLREPELFR